MKHLRETLYALLNQQAGRIRMRRLKETLHILLNQQAGQIQLFIIVPILTLSFLSLIVRTASSAVDPALEKKKVAEQLKRRLSEVQHTEEIALARATTLTSAPPLPLAPVVWNSTHKIRKNTTIEVILRNEVVNTTEAAEWIKAVRNLKEFKVVSPGQTLTLSFLEKDEDWTLSTLSYGTNQKSRLLLEKLENGRIGIKREAPLTVAWRAVSGQIEKNLYEAATKAGVPALIMDDFADMDWDLDFSSDLQAGDTFKVIFEEFQRDGKTVEYGEILAAEIVNKGKTFCLFSVPEEEQSVDLHAAGRPFLRYPLKFTRISSVFTSGRFHPVLKRTRPHRGVDFAAPAGTPVRAVASGTVTYAGRNLGYGIYVRIDHPGAYDSAYAHLRRIARGVKVGTKVERGQLIGYVGSTGLATGPHLHFELHKNGKYVNPLIAKLPIEESDFKPQQTRMAAEMRKRLTEKLATMKVGTPAVVSTVTATSQDARGAQLQQPS